jgi:hypothetical protein
MKHLRKLALLSSLALSFTVYADGTLPLPLEPEQPFEMMDASVNLTMKIDSQSKLVSRQPAVNGISPCLTTDEFYKVTGTVIYDGNPLRAVGVCKPVGKTLKRVVVAVDAEQTQYTLLDGAADNLISIAKFYGTITAKPLIPVSAPTGGTESTAAVVKFELLLLP